MVLGISEAFFCSKKLPEPSSHSTVVIIGGGMAGLSAVYGLRQFDSEVKIVLIEPKQYSEILWACYRSPFEEWVRKGSLINISKYCEEYNVQHVRQKVTKLTKDEVTLEDLDGSSNSRIQKFDVCCVAIGAGSKWEAMGRGVPTNEDESSIEHRLNVLKNEGERLLNAKSVVVIGGGLIGCELAGDIAGYAAARDGQASKPEVTLINSSDQLCPIMSADASALVKQQLESLGIKIILNEKATKVEKGVELQNSKEKIEADVVIETIGFQPLNGFVQEAFGPDAFDSKGWIQTDDHFVVTGSDNKVFAFGDCMSNLPNAGNIYFRTCATLGHNMKVALLLKKKEEKSDGNQSSSPAATKYETMETFEVPFAAYCNTSGPKAGIFYSDKFWTKRFFPWIKNTTMFFSSPKHMIGVKDEFTVLGSK